MNTDDHVFRAECEGLPHGTYCVIKRKSHDEVFMMEACRASGPILFCTFFTEAAAMNAAERWVKRHFVKGH